MRLTLRVTPMAVEAAGEILRRAGSHGWETPQCDTVIGYLPVDADSGKRIAEVWAQVRGLEEAGLDPGPGEVSVEVVPERPWEDVWKSYFQPVRVGRVIICPTWEQAQAGPGDVLVRLDPGMAFGSGAHATTRLCLRALQEELPEAGRLLDVGTGSGILAIAAAKLGASRVMAVDNDPDVLPIARDNAQLNGVADRIEILEGDIAATPPADWDVIVANIAPDPVIAAAPLARLRLVAGGAFIGAGIPVARAQQVQTALTAAGLPIERLLQEEEWVTVVARRHADSEGTGAS